MGLPGGVCLGREERAIGARGLSGARVLVTGASGFIGGRVAERLVLEHGARVRVLVRRVMGAARLARLPIEIALGDLADPSGALAAADCDFIFNCAKGAGADRSRRRAVDVGGVERLIEAARPAVARVIHVSTLAVYDLPRDGEVTEDTPPAPPGDPYSEDKLEGERVALALGARHGVPVTVVQPTVVYGPFAGVYGSAILEELRAGPLMLVDGGEGICNAVYIDDLVTALFSAAISERSPGERFLVSGPEHPTWRQFFGGFERMLGVERATPVSEAEALELWRRSRRRGWLLPEALRAVKRDQALRKRLLATREGVVLQGLIQRALPKLVREVQAGRAEHGGRKAEPPALEPLRPWVVSYLAKRARVRTDRARELLGYRPVFGLADGMRLTEAWARWAGYLG
jgi:nucleoside-diphosphate-sugar epimerase